MELIKMTIIYLLISNLYLLVRLRNIFRILDLQNKANRQFVKIMNSFEEDLKDIKEEMQ